jgi:hypothetical protein
MNTNANRPAAPQSTVSAAARIVTAIAVGAALALAWTGAERASHQAVQTATQAFSAGASHVTLPMVQVVGRRETAAPRSI